MSVEPRVLLASQKKRALEICQAAGVSPRDFAWEELRQAPRVSKLSHKPTDYYFLFDFEPGGTHVTEYSPGHDRAKFTERHNDWEKRWKHVENWANCLARELEADDFVRTVMQEPSLEAAFADEDNHPFTEPERELLLDRLDAVERHVIEMKTLTSDVAASIHSEFETLREESKRAGRKAWFRMLVGSVFWIGKMFFGKNEGVTLWHYVSEKSSSAVRAIQDMGSN